MRELWPKQIKAIEMTGESFRRGNKRVILAAPCGFGKTTVASHIMQKAIKKGNKSCFIVDRVELLDQAFERFYEDGLDPGVIQGKHPMTDYSKMCQVATIQTLKNRRMQDFGLVIIDEAHTLFGTHKKYMTTYSNIPFIGLSATPYTKGLGDYFQDLIVPATTAEMIADGSLCNYECYAPSTPDLTGVKITRGDYDESALAERCDTRKLVGDIVATHQLRSKGRPTVVFAVSIAHSKHIIEEFRKIGLRATHVDCYTDKDARKIINDQQKAGHIDIISCVGIYEKGWDSPITSCLIDAAPTKSIMRYHQRWGRILRTHESKELSMVMDHSGNSERHGWMENIVPDHLATGKEKESDACKKDKVNKKSKPKACGKCGYLKDTFVCSKCGYTPEYIENVEIEEGELEKKSKKQKATTREKEDWYAMFLFHANEQGYSPGWAYYKCREKFGAGVKSKDVTPKEPTTQALGYIKYLNIKAAKSKKRAG